MAVLWIVGAATGSLLHGPPAALLQVVGVGPGALAGGRWWTPISSAVWCADLTGYLVTTALLLTLVAPAEHRFGAAKTCLLLLITQIVGTLAGSRPGRNSGPWPGTNGPNSWPPGSPSAPAPPPSGSAWP